MSSEPPQDLGELTRVDRPAESAHRLAGSCEGCRELTARIERLEQAFALSAASAGSYRMGTTRCYWICVGAHALSTMMLFCSEALIQLAMMMSIGAVGTLGVCQVLSTRPIHLRLPRTLLSTSVVATAAVLGMWVGDVAEPTDVLPGIVVLFPPAFAGVWLVAKLFVWIGGWRIVPPNHATEYPRLRIQHLLLCTMLAAAYLALGRTMSAEIEGWLNDDLNVMIVYLLVPTTICTIVSCLMARIVLSSPTAYIVSRALVLGFATIPLMAITFALALACLGGLDVDWQSLLGVMPYAIPLTIGACASSGWTFSMMRLADYRFRSHRCDVPLMPQTTIANQVR